jgi:hypothetical protein
MLIAHESGEGHGPADDVAAVAKAVHSTAIELSRWVGPDGCNALLTRALNRSGQDHGALKDLSFVANSAPALVGLEESIAKSGEPAVILGLTGMLKELFDLLQRVIGEDLTYRLAEQITGVRFESAREDEEGSH